MLKGAMRLFAGGLIGKILGVLREGLLAYLYGTSAVVAANRIAQTAVLAPLNLVTTDALSSAYLPMQATLVRDQPGLAIALYRGVQATVGAFGALVVLLLLFWRHQLVDIVAPGLTGGVISLSVSMVVIMLIGVPSYLHFGMLAYLEMAHQSYKLSSIRSSGQSIGLIVGTVAGFVLHRPSLLAWGFTVGYLLMSLWGMRYIKGRGYLRTAPPCRWSVVLTSVRPFLVRLRAVILLPIMSQAQVVTEKMTASHMGVTAVAAVDYARLISDTALLLLAVPIGLAALPSYALLAPGEIRTKLLRMIAPFTVIAVVLSALAACFGRPIVRAAFERGAFGADSAYFTSQIFIGLAVGLWALLVSYILLRVLNALGRNWHSVAVMAGMTAATIGLRTPLVAALGPLGLGLAVAVGAIIGALAALALTGILRPALTAVVPVLPGVAGTILLGWWCRSWTLSEQLLTLAASLVLWIGYLSLVPDFRRFLTQVRKARLARASTKIDADVS